MNVIDRDTFSGRRGRLPAAVVCVAALGIIAGCGPTSVDGDRDGPGGGSSSGGTSSGSSGGTSSSGSSSGGTSSGSSGGTSSGSSGGTSSGSSSGTSSSSSGSGPLPDGTLYVSPGGTSAGDGTERQPLDLETAIAKVAAGGTIALKGGTYAFSKQITISRAVSGKEGAPKALVAVPGERPVLDFSTQPYGDASSTSNPRGIALQASWWHVKGLEVKGAADNGMYVSGSHDVVEACTFHGNRDTGLQIGRETSSTARADWPSHNLVLNCESYDNHDGPPNAGENADGFACKLTSGPGNVFRGCVAHHNIDDGWDLYTKSDTGAIDPVVIDQCVAFANGTLTDGTTNANGDRNGFKLGGSSIAVAHVVTRSIAFRNGKNGFTWNSNPGVIWMVNNTAWDNVAGNFKFDDPSEARFANNVSFWTAGDGIADRAGASSGTVIPDNALWDRSKHTLWGFTGAAATLSAADLQSTAAPARFPLPRLADGRIDLGALARPSAASALVDVGVVPAVPAAAGVAALPFAPAYYQGAPDAGAIEAR